MSGATFISDDLVSYVSKLGSTPPRILVDGKVFVRLVLVECVLIQQSSESLCFTQYEQIKSKDLLFTVKANYFEVSMVFGHTTALA